MGLKKIALGLFLFLAAMLGGFFIFYQDVLTPFFYSQTVKNEDEIHLSGGDVLLIRDTFYVQANDITLRDRAKLIIEDSLFKVSPAHALEFKLKAEDSSQVIIRNSTVKISGSMRWNFGDQSKLVIEDTNNLFSSAWIGCGDNSECLIKDSSKFEGTVWGNASLTLQGTPRWSIFGVPRIFIEISLPVGAKMDEALPIGRIGKYEFPNKGEEGIFFKLKIRSGTNVGRWGISLPSIGKVTLRDTVAGIGMRFDPPYFQNSRIELSGLKNMIYQDKTWEIGKTQLRLINTKVDMWYPYASDENIVIIKDSNLADNILSSDKARFLYENITIGVIKARDEVEITVKDSEIHGDVIAQDNGRIVLINTKTRYNPLEKYELIERDNGKIIVQ
jgi:hypothetical protein